MRLSRVAVLCVVALALCGAVIADQAAADLVEPEYHDSPVVTAPIDKEGFHQWQEEHSKEQLEAPASDLQSFEEPHDMGSDVQEHDGGMPDGLYEDEAHASPIAALSDDSLSEGPDSALRAEVAENHEAEAEAANDHAIEEQAFDDEPEHENEEALKEDDGKIFDSTLQSFDEDGESNADEENFDEADDNDAIEEHRRPESKRGSRRLSTRPAKGASKKRGSKKGSKSRKGKARRRKNPRRRKMRKLAKRLRKYLKRKQRKAGKQSANKSLAPRFQSLIAKDPHADVRAMWQQFKQLKARVAHLHSRLAAGPKKSNDTAAFATRVNGKITAVRAQITDVLGKIRVHLLQFHEGAWKQATANFKLPAGANLTDAQKANPALYAPAGSRENNQYFFTGLAKQRALENGERSQKLKDHLKAYNGVIPETIPRWSETRVKTPEQQEIWNDMVKRAKETEAARAQATRDAVAYNAALRWTGMRFNDSTVNMAMKFPNISDPTVRYLPSGDANSPLSRAFWNNVKEAAGKGNRTQLTEAQSEATDPQEQAFLQRVAQREGVWDYRVGGLDWSMGQCATGNMQSPIPLRHGAQNSSVVHYATEGRAFALKMNYWAADKFSLINDGHALRIVPSKNVSMANLGFIVNDGVRYIVKSIEFHTPSEHAFEANDENQRGRYPFELQIIHQKEGSNGTDNLLIVSVMFHVKRTPGNNKFLHNIDWNKAPKLAGYRQRINGAIDLKDLQYSFDGEYFAYNGSMTRPPCSENVRWFVMTIPQGITEWEYNVIRNIFVDRAAFSGGRGNARVVQARNGRNVVLVRRHNFEEVGKPSPHPQANVIDGMDRVPKKYVFPKVCPKGETC